ncbi:hypothetical protein OYT88_18130 [Sporolactobacillus sp. CQH2019]|uniref:hypothetical protein n=1 Tax=Sporolactobacillus sp. CQH2019 TaxID=3023512 RepID=UPI002367E978|nr:hypothetical protein [Sporolactobacillus sp. CQH2019]MDD9150458.1 hypothetical protein [Sporolactobacillus sp. CQH2019]
MFKNHQPTDRASESKQELRRSRLLFFLLLSGFVLVGSLYLWERLAPAKPSVSAPDKQVTIAGKRPADDKGLKANSSSSRSSSAHSTVSGSPVSSPGQVMDADGAKAVVSQFISQYFTYDWNNPYQHLADVQTLTDAGFYQALSNAQTNNTHVPSYRFRRISNVVTQTPSKNGDVETVQATMKVQTFDSNNKLMGSEKDTVSVDLKTENGALKVNYFASSLNE